MRLATMSARTIDRYKLALAGLAAAAAVGYAATLHAQSSMPSIPFIQRVEYTSSVPGSGPAPLLRSAVGDGATSLSLTWDRRDEGSTGAYLFSCNSAVSTEDLGEACDVSSVAYDSFDIGDTATATLDSAAAQRDTLYLVETGADGTWRTIDHVTLLRFSVSIPFVSR